MNVEPKTSWRRSDQFPNIHGSMYYRNPTIQPPHEHVRHFHCSNHHQTTINISLIHFLFSCFYYTIFTEKPNEGMKECPAGGQLFCLNGGKCWFIESLQEPSCEWVCQLIAQWFVEIDFRKGFRESCSINICLPVSVIKALQVYFSLFLVILNALTKNFH